MYNAITFGFEAVTAAGIKYPRHQIFIDAKNHNSMRIDCHEISGGTIECKITEVGVFHDSPTHNFLPDWLDIAKQACTIVSTTYTQQFQYNEKTGNWAWNDAKPHGTCGTIEAGYLTKDTTIKDSDSWSYTEKMIFTNKAGDLCSHVYDVTSDYYSNMSPKNDDLPLQVNCKYINFLQTAYDIQN
ncbi:MAG: hypothetical protein Q8L78_01535 [Coxiellaceae bacterium]|nr:hypothetical protein [Coxiellaceae bacterium]